MEEMLSSCFAVMHSLFLLWFFASSQAEIGKQRNRMSGGVGGMTGAIPLSPPDQRYKSDSRHLLDLLFIEFGFNFIDYFILKGFQ
jgi:hypothetical protein